MGKPNPQNLIPLNKRSKEEQRKIQQSGGLANAKKIKEKKLIKDTINEFLSAVNPATGNNFQVDLVMAQLNKAIIDGDTAAFNALRDTAGQKPKEDVQVVNMPIINIKGL